MKIIKLTQGKETIVDDDDYYKLIDYKCHYDGVYAGLTINNKKVRLHRVILGINNPDIKVDHINRNTLDNRKENLRLVTQQQNMFNKGNKIGSKSIYKGVSLHTKNRNWIAHIRYNKKTIHIGSYNSEIDAAIAYNKKAFEFFKEYAYLNIIIK